jgi:hypothetical protein
LATGIGSLSLSAFFLWSVIDEDSIPLGVAIAAGLGGVTVLIESALQFRDRRHEDKAEPSDAE